MELRHLRYFVAVAEELHVGRAAQRLHIAQPPLSRQIHDLEHELGVRLFRRQGRRIVLTDAGKVFFQGAQRTLDQLGECIHLARRADQGDIGQMTIGFVSAAAMRVVPIMLREFRALHPDVTVQVRSMTSRDQIVAMQRGDLTLGIVRLPVTDPALASRVILRESLLAILPDTHPLAQQEQISLQALAQESFILYPRADGPAIYDMIVGYCRQAGFSPVVVQEASEGLIMNGLVASGIGVALRIGELGDVASLQGSGIVIKPISDAIPLWEMALMWRKDDSSPVLQRFLEVAQHLSTEVSS
jgi:DNA-binding transcriptional LysR family regulator